MANFEAFYSALQQRFRGSYDDIKLRLRAYLPALQEVGAGSSNGGILDLGSGRGEWLDLLKESNLNAEGVDHNPTSNQQASTRGVLIHTGDVLDYLQHVDDCTYGAITAFHLIEHLDWTSQLTLLEQTHRALRSNGIIILEWPNIEDIRVATQYFWFDPTHVRPLPHQLLAFMAEFSGFRNLKLLRFRPDSGVSLSTRTDRWRVLRDAALERSMADLERTWNEFLSPGADIALIGQKIGE